MKPLKENISITLDGPLLKEIKELALYDGRSTSQYINLVLQRHVESLKQADNPK